MKRSNLNWIIILFITAGLGGCKSSGTQSDDIITVDVTANYPKKELILQDFMDVEYIPLETTDEFITSANLLAIGKDVIIIKNATGPFSPNGNDMYIFDRKGKGLRVINRHGQSNEEYTNIQGVVLDEESGEIFVNNTFSKKVVVYDLLGNFKRSFHQKDNLTLNQTSNFDRSHIIAHDNYFHLDNGVIEDEKRNCFLIMSKQDGNIKEIPIPYKEKKSTIVFARDANGNITNDRAIYNREIIPYRNGCILTEPSADTIYSYSPDHTMKPFIARTPSVQSMDPEVFLFTGVLTDRYFFMQSVTKEYDFEADNGFPCTDLIYDTQEKAIFECIVYNNDFTDKRPMSLVYEYPMFTFANNEIAIMKRLEAFELVEAYKRGQLKGKLKEIAATLNEESNPVIMLVKHKNNERS